LSGNLTFPLRKTLYLNKAMKSFGLPIFWCFTTTITIFACFFCYWNLSLGKNNALALQSSSNLLVDSTVNLVENLPQKLGKLSQEITAQDARPAIVEQFLKKRNSPLAPYANYMVKVADQYQIDFRLLAAIAVKESGGGKAIPKDSYNAWGWGIYGDQVLGFNTWQDGIKKVAEGLKNEYIDKGYRTPQELMQKYVPASLEKGGPWAQDVQEYLREME